MKFKQTPEGQKEAHKLMGALRQKYLKPKKEKKEWPTDRRKRS